MKLALGFLLLVTCGAFSQAQDSKTNYTRRGKPDFSGTWQLDRLKSELNSKVIVVSGPTVTLTIDHSEPDLKIIQTTDSEGAENTVGFRYQTDGSGEINPPSRSYLALFDGSKMSNPDPSKVESRSQWKGKKLKTRSAVVISLPNGKRTTVKVEEVWEMVRGETLIQTISFSSDSSIHFNPGKMKKVYTRTL